MRPTTTQAEREHAQAEALINHYRAIGPAAVLAALICAKKKGDEETPAARRAD